MELQPNPLLRPHPAREQFELFNSCGAISLVAEGHSDDLPSNHQETQHAGNLL